MPNRDLVVSDTSPLLNLSLIGRLDLLESQFSGLTIPEQVWSELTDGESGSPDTSQPGAPDPIFGPGQVVPRMQSGGRVTGSAVTEIPQSCAMTA